MVVKISGVYMFIFLVIIPIAFFVPNVLVADYHKPNINETRTINPECEIYGSEASATVTINSYDLNDDKYSINVTYTFNLNNTAEVSEKWIQITSTNDRTSIKSDAVDLDNGTIQITTQSERRISYRNRFTSDKNLIYKPDFRISMLNFIHGSGGLYDYKNYYDCFNKVQYDGVAVGFFTSNDMTIQFGDKSSEAVIYNISNSESDRNTYIMGSVSEKQLADASSIIKTAGSYNSTFDSSTKIEIYTTEDINVLGFIVGRGTKNPIIFMKPDYMVRDEEVMGHEWAHSFQNFGTSDETGWWIEGSAEYLGSLIETEARTPESEAINEAFNFGWNQRAMDENMSNYRKLRLNEPDSWEYADYNRGSRVAYLVDISIRYHTDGQRNILDLIRKMNKESNIDEQFVEETLSNMTSENFVSRYNRLVSQNSTVEVEKELQDMPVDLNEVEFPATFDKKNNQTIIRCEYEGNVATAEDC
jgi:hypothetical protein